MKKNKEQLINEIECLRIIIDNLDYGVHVVDENGVTVLYNKAMEKVELMNRQDLFNKNVLDFYQLSEETSLHLQVLKTGQALHNKHIEYTTKDGTTINLIADVFPIIKNNKAIYSAGVTRDITSIKKLSNRLLELQTENRMKTRQKSQDLYRFSDLVTASHLMTKTIETAKKLSRGLSPIMIVGETGTGKEMFAQSIHSETFEQNAPFVAINCSAIPETLLESILFGTGKGAYTGAVEKPGLISHASGGTLFLDELSAMNISMQSKLLRVVETRKVRPVGHNKEFDVSVRFISAMNLEPEVAIKNNLLRRDLYYRLAVANLKLPPLRERKEDIEPLINSFIEINNLKMDKNIECICPEAMDIFMTYEWLGNVRELENALEFAFYLVGPIDREIGIEHIPIYLLEKNTVSFSAKTAASNLKTTPKFDLQNLQNLLEKNNGNISKTARELGISRQHLQYYIKKRGIEGGSVSG